MTKVQLIIELFNFLNRLFYDGAAAHEGTRIIRDLPACIAGITALYVEMILSPPVPHSPHKVTAFCHFLFTDRTDSFYIRIARITVRTPVDINNSIIISDSAGRQRRCSFKRFPAGIYNRTDSLALF